MAVDTDSVGATTATTTATGDYIHLKDRQRGGEPVVTSFFVYSAWGLPSWLSSSTCGGDDDDNEPHLGRGVPLSTLNQKGLEHVLIAGAVYAASRKGLDKFARYDWRHYLYFCGFVLAILGFWVTNHNLLATYVDPYLFEGIGDWSIGVFLAAVLWNVACLVHAWAVWGLETDLTQAMEDLNYPLFQLAGYRLLYRVEPSGPAYTLEHRIYVFGRADKIGKQKKDVSLLDVLPDSTRPLFTGAKTVYLHTASFWGDDGGPDKTGQTLTEKEYMHRHDQPTMLRSIHHLLWGALHQAFWVDNMEQLRSQRRVRTIDALLATFLAVLWLFPSLAADQDKVSHSANVVQAAHLVWRSYLLAALLIVTLTAFYWAFLQVLMNRSAATVGHARWTRAAALLGPILEKYSWRLEYQHPFEYQQEHIVDEEEDRVSLWDTCKSVDPPEYSLHFNPYVPVNSY